jgi:DNA replication protein DnaC
MLIAATLEQQLRQLCLSTFAKQHLVLAQQCEQLQQTYLDYLGLLVQQELEHRYQQRIQRLLKQAKLPRNKLLSDFNSQRVPGLSPTLLQGAFIERYENILIFGNPGTGKTHLSIALAREWCLLGRKVYYCGAAALVQQLLQAKAQLKLNQFIKRMDSFEVLLIDDVSYIPYAREEMDVLFQLLSARYEMRSTLITSNLPFAKWDTIFKDEMTTAAVVDRLIHHAVILELNTESYRIAAAKKQRQEEGEQAKKANKK